MGVTLLSGAKAVCDQENFGIAPALFWGPGIDPGNSICSLNVVVLLNKCEYSSFAFIGSHFVGVSFSYFDWKECEQAHWPLKVF